MTLVIELPVLPPPVDQLWHTLLDLGDQLDVPWALIGGQMVLLHAIEHGQVPPQVSQDGDVIADIRAVPGALTHVVAGLEHMGFAQQSISADGLAHRYTRTAEPRPVVIDVLAPEGLGERADLTTTPPGRTIEVPGGTQALSRTELITVVHERRSGTIPRPTLLAAIVGKAAATALPGPDRHYRDLALLCSLVGDPFETRRLDDSQGPPAAASGEKAPRRLAPRLAAPAHCDQECRSDRLRRTSWLSRRYRDEVLEDFVIARNAEPGSTLPYLLRIPLGDGIILKAKDTWPRTGKVYCHRVEEWPANAEIIERVRVRSCVRRGAAIDLVLDRGRENRSQIVVTNARGRQMILLADPPHLQARAPCSDPSRRPRQRDRGRHPRALPVHLR